MQLDPSPTPKMGDGEKCVSCGRCILGCGFGAKWDSRTYLADAVRRGARVLTDRSVEYLVFDGGRATGVVARHGLRREFVPADLVVLAAGGLGSPDLLRASGIACEPRLATDPVLCVAAEWERADQCYEIAMPFVVQREGYIVSPYFDYLSFFFDPGWRWAARNTLTLMIKFADSNAGAVTNGHVLKSLTADDRTRIEDGIRLCTEVFRRLGIPQQRVVTGLLNAGHPAGMLPLNADSAASMHDARLPDNLYVADASLLPRALGNPPILTIVAIAKRIGAICRERWA
jgi:choline dehydrogenase-like flavoprotein